METQWVKVVHQNETTEFRAQVLKGQKGEVRIVTVEQPVMAKGDVITADGKELIVKAVNNARGVKEILCQTAGAKLSGASSSTRQKKGAAPPVEEPEKS